MLFSITPTFLIWSPRKLAQNNTVSCVNYKPYGTLAPLPPIVRHIVQHYTHTRTAWPQLQRTVSCGPPLPPCKCNEIYGTGCNAKKKKTSTGRRGATLNTTKNNLITIIMIIIVHGGGSGVYLLASLGRCVSFAWSSLLEKRNLDANVYRISLKKQQLCRYDAARTRAWM